jgi:hypothetical protein
MLCDLNTIEGSQKRASIDRVSSKTIVTCDMIDGSAVTEKCLGCGYNVIATPYPWRMSYQ